MFRGSVPSAAAARRVSGLPSGAGGHTHLSETKKQKAVDQMTERSLKKSTPTDYLDHTMSCDDLIFVLENLHFARPADSQALLLIDRAARDFMVRALRAITRLA